MLTILDIFIFVLFIDGNVFSSHFQLTHFHQTVMVMFNTEIGVNDAGDVIMSTI